MTKNLEKFVVKIIEQVNEKFSEAVKINELDPDNLKFQDILSLSVILTLNNITRNPTEFLIFAKNTLLEYQKDFPLHNLREVREK